MSWIFRPTSQGVYKKDKSYSKHSIILSNQETAIDQFFDFIDYDTLNTTADVNNVYILIDDDSIPFRLSDVAGTAVEGNRIRIRSEPTEWGKTLVIILGREYKYFSIKGKVSILPDSIQTLLMSASGYNVMDIDLGVARSDQLIALNVISFKILESTTPSAIYNIKLFSTANPPLTETIIPPGTIVQHLRRASLYLSNPAQTGVTLSILIFVG